MTAVDLITGFLGAGKTTFIKRYAAWLQALGQRVAVVENEFGAAGVDTALLRDGCAAVEELTGGCICCGLKVNFYHLLTELTASGAYDRVIVEPSGVFALDDYFDVADSPAIRASAENGAVITVVDPDVLETDDAFLRERLFEQLHSTGAILFSRLPSADRAASLTAALDGLYAAFGARRSPEQRVIARPWESLTDADMESLRAASPVRQTHERKDNSHAALFNSTTLSQPAAWTEEAIRRRLAEAFTGACGDVLRVKGGVRLTDGRALLLNGTPTSLSFEETDGRTPPALNVIGRHLNRTALRRLFTP